MSFNKFLSECALIPEFWEQELVYFKRQGPNDVSTYYHPGVSEKFKLVFAIHRGLEGLAVSANTYCLNQVLYHGPKILRLTNLDYELLEETEVNVPLNEYKQPYPAMVVEFPEEYLKAREIPNIMAGELSRTTWKPQDAINKPRCVVVAYDEQSQVLIADMLSNDGQGFSCSIRDMAYNIDENLERLLQPGNELADSLPISEDERDVAKRLMRAAINACLIATEIGYSKRPQNPVHLKRLQHYVDVARKKKSERLAKAQRDVRQHPQILEINQEVLLKTARERDRTEGGTEREVGPHRRKGHHRRQRHGPALSLVKRIWIPPTRVNWHKFAGLDRNTSVVIKTQGG
jgi:hypothetical protein